MPQLILVQLFHCFCSALQCEQKKVQTASLLQQIDDPINVFTLMERYKPTSTLALIIYNTINAKEICFGLQKSYCSNTGIHCLRSVVSFRFPLIE